MLDETKRDDGTPVFDSTLVKTTLSEIGMIFENIRTTNEDPNSTKISCEASLKITTSENLFDKAETGRKLLGMVPIENLARTSNFEQFSNTFTKAIEYTVQPTDDGKNIVAGLPQAKALATFISELAGAASIDPVIVRKIAAKESKARAGQFDRTARIQIAEIEQALDLFKLDVGRYPTETEGLGAVVENSSTSSGWNGPYLKSGLPSDPWGSSYQYKNPGRNGSPDVYSLGADGKSGGEAENADIYN